MKIFRILLWAFLLVAGFTACSKENDATLSNDHVIKQLAGKWKLTERHGASNVEAANIIWEFKKDFSYNYSSNDPKDNRYSCKFGIENGWNNTDGKIDGYISIYRYETGPTLFHCWIEKNKMTVIDAISESCEDCVYFLDPYMTFTKQ